MSAEQYKYELIIDSVTYELSESPAGWEEVGLTYTRSKTYESVLVSHVPPLKFLMIPGGGGIQLSELYFRDGVSAFAQIIISVKDPDTDGYVEFYTGDINFRPENVSIDKKEKLFECGIIANGDLAKFRAREDINIDLMSENDLDGNNIGTLSLQDVKYLPVDIYLRSVVDAKFNKEYEWIGAGVPEGPDLTGRFDELELVDKVINQIGDRIVYDEDGVIYENKTDLDVYLKYDSATVKSGAGLKVRVLQAGLIGTATAELGVVMSIAVVNSDDITIFNQPVFSENLTFSTSSPGGETQIVDLTPGLDNLVSESIPSGRYLVPSGSKAFIKLTLQPQNFSPLALMEYSGNNYTLSFDMYELSEGRPTNYIPSLMSINAYERAFESLGGLSVYSDYFGYDYSPSGLYSSNGAGSAISVTNSANLRQFPSPEFNISIQNLFLTHKGVNPIGLGYDKINSRFFIEPIENFYKSSLLMFDVGEVSEFIIKPYQHGLFAGITSGGASKGSYENFQGANEYNVNTEHTNKLELKPKLTTRTAYNIDTLGQELLRRLSYDIAASEDSKQDDNVYILDTDRTNISSWETKRNGSSVAGWKGVEQYYNIRFSPRNSLIEWSGVLNSCLWNQPKEIKFVKSSKSLDVTYNGVNQKSDLTDVDLVKTALFEPNTYTFEAAFLPQYVAQLEKDPHGLVMFSYDNISYVGFVIKISAKDYNRKATYELLAHKIAEGTNFIWEDDTNIVMQDGSNMIIED